MAIFDDGDEKVAIMFSVNLWGRIKLGEKFWVM